MNVRELNRIGPYPVVEFIAEGGMAWVFKVVDERFGVHRALKMLKPHAAQGEEFKRFEAEAKFLARLDHPNLITIFDLGKDEETACHYYTMTYVDGPTLSDTGVLPAPEAVDIFLDVLSALAKLHDQHIIHRDIKPGNILTMSDGRVLLGDLGIARQQDQLISLTRTGMAIGSVQYMSPEQARGDAVSPRSDVFSVGLSLFQVLSGRTIYDAVDEVDATSGEQVLMYLGALIHSGGELKFEFPPGIPRAVRRVIETACRFDPTERYADASEMRHALARAAEETEPIEIPKILRKGKNLGMIGGALAAVALVGGLIWGFSDGDGPVVPPGPGDGIDGGGAGPVPGDGGSRPDDPGDGGSGPTGPPALPERYAAAIALLASPDATRDEKRGIVDDMSQDPSPESTRVLLTAADDAQVPVAVKAVKALNARIDDAIAAKLVGLVEIAHRSVAAYAARGLADACREEAAPSINARLEIEDHAATQRWLRDSLEKLASCGVDAAT